MILKTFTPKPGKCKHCRGRLDSVGQKLHEGCITPWWEANKAKVWAKTKKVEKAKDRARRKEQEKIPDLIELAQRAFNAYIRERDKNQPCICCGQPLGNGEIGGRYDCGHYRSRGAASSLRFDERNAHAQRKYCNRRKAGNVVEYRAGLIARIGLAAVEELEAANAVRKWTREELREIRALYQRKLKELKGKA